MRSERIDPGSRRDGVEAVIHEEINRLPAHYRAAVVLCELEGRTHEQAARHMGCAVGTVKSRLARGRERLRERLTRRGLAPEACTLSSLTAGAGRTIVPPSLVEVTVRFAMAGKGSSGAVPVVLALLARLAQRRDVMIKALLMTAVAMMLGRNQLLTGRP